MPVRDPHARHFPAAIQSLLEQTMQDIEILVVEDAGSRPRSEDNEVRRAADDLSRFDDARIRVLRNDAPGIASARNQGLAGARAGLVAMLDADDVSAPDRLARQCERMDDDTDLAVLGSQLRLIDEDDREQGHRRYPVTHDEIVRTLPIYNPIAQPSVVFRKAVVEAAGGYRDRTCEDYDLWSRLALSGARFANLDAALVSYRLHTGAMKHRRLRASLRDTIDIKREHWRGRQSFRGRARLLGERALLVLPPAIVMALFRRLYTGHAAPAP